MRYFKKALTLLLAVMISLNGAGIRVFAEEKGLSIVGDIPRCDDINRFEDMGMTVIEGDPQLPISRTFTELAERLLQLDR